MVELAAGLNRLGLGIAWVPSLAGVGYLSKMGWVRSRIGGASGAESRRLASTCSPASSR